MALAAQLEALARALGGDDSTPLATADDGLAVMTVLDTARRSAAAGGERVSVQGSSGSLRRPRVAIVSLDVLEPGRPGASSRT